MICEFCDKEFDSREAYCPHCGRAAREPAEAGHRDIGDSARSSRKGFILFSLEWWTGLLIVLPILWRLRETGFPSLFFGLLLGLFPLSFFLIAHSRNRKHSRIPLLKRAAAVCEKEKRGDVEDSVYSITFRFPDHTELRLRVPKETYSELKEGDRIVLKYKIIGAYMQCEFFGFERLADTVY